MEVQIFFIVTNVFVSVTNPIAIFVLSVTNPIAIFVLIMGISMILIMFRDRWIKLM